MKKKLIVLVMLIFLAKGWGQEKEIVELAKKDLAELKKRFDVKKDSLDKETSILLELTKKLDPKQSDQYLKVVKKKKELDIIYNKRKVFKEYYSSKNVPDSIINNRFPEQTDFAFLEENGMKEEMPEKKVYFLFGDDDLISEDDLIKNKEVNQVFSKVINQKSKSNLGKFEIPAVGQLIPIYSKDKDSPKSEGNRVGFASFEEINITLVDGSLEDVRVTLIDKINNIKYYFENRLATSLLRYTLNSKGFYIYNSFACSIDNKKPFKNELAFVDSYICIKDILRYYPNSGNNYVPDDQNLIFPVPSRKEIQDTSKIGVYELVQNTSLQNTIELRTYTDFLGLFNDSPNGIVQIQGKADFYFNPFRFSGDGFMKSIYILKKITPFVNFSKIDDENRGLNLISTISSTDTIYSIKTPLEILEKSYLELGVNINIFSVKFIKEMPFRFNVFFPLRYNTTSVFNEKSDNTNFKLVTYGIGGGLEFKRFSNFGFNYNVEYTTSESINKYENVTNPEQFKVLKNEAEIFYYPGESKNQSIFTRFRTFYNSKDDRDSFFQFQFGYRFTIGAGRAKM